MNAWLELPLAVADLVLTVGASLLSGLAELTRPATIPAAGEPVTLCLDDGHPVTMPRDDDEWARAVAQLTTEWREGGS